MNRKVVLIKSISPDLCKFAVLARRKIESIGNPMVKFFDNARTVKVHKDGLISLINTT